MGKPFMQDAPTHAPGSIIPSIIQLQEFLYYQAFIFYYILFY
jgi:hypothetical protein